MITAICAVSWWVIGIAAMLWLMRDRDLTWGDLFYCMCLGLIGPAIAIVIAFVVLVQAEFWSKPVFRKRHQ